MTMDFAPKWPEEACAFCKRPMTKSTILVVQSVRQDDDSIGFVDPPLGKVCGRACLLLWATKLEWAT